MTYRLNHRSNHRPQSNQRCARWKCQHAWTLRYRVNGKQLEKSFKDTTNENTGRVNYGMGAADQERNCRA